MKKITLLLLATFLTSFQCLLAQKAKVKISPEFKVPKNKFFQDHLYSDESGHYIYFTESAGFMGTKSRVILEKYGTNLQEKFSKEFEADEKGVSMMGLRYVKGNFAWLLAERNSKEDFMRYFITPIDLTGKKGKSVTVAKFKYERKKDIPLVYWNTSLDTTRIVFMAIDDHDDDEEKTDVFVAVVDQNFNKVWEQRYKLPCTEEQFQYRSLRVANNGDVFLLGKVYTGEKAKETRKDKDNDKVAGYNMKIFMFRSGLDKPKAFDLNLKGAFVKGVDIELTPGANQELACVGFQGKTNRGPASGFFYLRLSPETGEAISTNLKDFSRKELDILEDRDNDDKGKKGERGIDTDFIFKDLAIRQDGSVFLTSEENFSRTYTSNTGRTITTRTVYYSYDIIVLSINPDGSVGNLSIIPKRQASETPLFQSFTSLVNENYACFFYNDDEKNIKRPIGERVATQTSFRDAASVMTSVDKAGKLKRKALFTEKDDVEALFVPKQSKQISRDEVFFVAQRFKLFGKTEFQIGTIKVTGE